MVQLDERVGVYFATVFAPQFTKMVIFAQQCAGIVYAGGEKLMG
jgi:hypothetical protein